MKKVLGILILALVISLSSCNLETVKGSAEMVEKTYDIKDFENISIKNTFKVTVLESEEFRVVVKCNENIEQYLKVTKEGNTLNLFLEENKNYINVYCNVIVYMPTIKSIQTQGASKVVLSSIHSDRLEIKGAGASKIGGYINVRELGVNISGASKIELIGKVEKGVVHCKGASKFDGKDLIFNKLTFISAGASKTTAHVIDELNVNLSGASKFDYYGKPQVLNKKINGIGKINHLN